MVFEKVTRTIKIVNKRFNSIKTRQILDLVYNKNLMKPSFTSKFGFVFIYV